MFDKSLEYSTDLLDVFLEGIGVDQYVVDVNYYKLVQHVPEDIVYEGLEDRRTVD